MKIKKRNKNKTTFNSLFAQKIAYLQFEGRYQTIANYRSVLKLIEAEFGMVYCSDVDANFVKRLSRNQMSHLSDSTKALYFAMIKSVFNYGVYKGVCDESNFPFQRKSYQLDKVKIPKIAKRTDSYLTKEDMNKLYQYWLDLPTDKSRPRNKKRYLGLFLCSYLCNGCNINDLLRFTYNKDYFANNKQIITFIRHKIKEKSSNKIVVPIIPQLRVLLDFLADEEQPNELIFGSFFDGYNVADDETYAKKITIIVIYTTEIMKKVAKDLGLRNDISTTFARHTYSTVMHHSNVPFSVVEASLGHTSSIAFNYIGQTPIEDLFKYNSWLLD